ncbi:MAG: hypothetical protein AAFR38_09830 [Planctomycetota bacterium]
MTRPCVARWLHRNAMIAVGLLALAMGTLTWISNGTSVVLGLPPASDVVRTQTSLLLARGQIVFRRMWLDLHVVPGDKPGHAVLMPGPPPAASPVQLATMSAIEAPTGVSSKAEAPGLDLWFTNRPAVSFAIGVGGAPNIGTTNGVMFGVPLWFSVVLALPLVPLAAWRRRRIRRKRGFCVDCGYDLREIAGPVCPECGLAVARPTTSPQVPDP